MPPQPTLFIVEAVMIGTTRIGAVVSTLLGVSVLACGPAEERPATEEKDAAPGASAEQVGVQDASAEEAIRQFTADYEAAVAEGDFEDFLATYTDDVVVYPPGEPPLVGKEAFRGWARPLFDRFELEETITYEGLKTADDWALGWYRYSFTTTPKAGGEAATEEGHGMVALRRQPDGTWKWSHAAWNSDGPPAQEP